jgi:hypothetical protein
MSQGMLKDSFSQNSHYLHKMALTGNVLDQHKGCARRGLDALSTALDPYQPYHTLLDQPYHMSDTFNEPLLIPADAAKEIGVSVHTIRRWCEWHAAHLSPQANPPPGAPRQVTWRDIEVFKTVKELRARGLQTPAINEELATLTFAVIEPYQDEPGTEIVETTPPKPEENQTALLVLKTINTVLERVEAIEANQQQANRQKWDSVTLIAIGFIAATLLFLVILLLAWLNP